jgi:hypothetical protein
MVTYNLTPIEKMGLREAEEKGLRLCMIDEN